MCSTTKDFHYVSGSLYAESVSLVEITQRFGTPVYVYSQAAIKRNWQSLYDALKTCLSSPPELAYAVKANSNLAVLNQLACLGSGFDVVSGGELQRVLQAGGDPKKIFFSGVGKTSKEIQQAIEAGIACMNIESASELERIEKIAADRNIIVSAALRINPDVDPATHPYIATGLKETKFGIDWQQARELYKNRDHYPHIKWVGIACHIGSQILEVDPFIKALNSLLDIYDELADEGLCLEHIDLGGGLGIRYTTEDPISLTQFAEAIAETLGNRLMRIVIEPGRFIVGNAGVLVTQVEYLKQQQDKHFAVVDAGMNDLLRPALYQAVHPVWPVELSEDKASAVSYDIVGPVCETADCLAKNQKLCLKEGDYLAVGMAGAYGFSMSSHYNSRPNPPEVMVTEDKYELIRVRETLGDLIKSEQLLSKPKIKFRKMQALGNDFIVIDNIRQKVPLKPEWIRAMSDRHCGIGFDQALIIEPSGETGIDFFYRIFNPDGTESGQCGNGARCIARFIHEEGLSHKRNLTVATQTSILELELHDETYQAITVMMGIPQLEPSKVPLNVEQYQEKYPFHYQDKTFYFHALSMGNPHAVIPVDDLLSAPVQAVGNALNQRQVDSLFPEGVNAGFMQLVDPHHLKLRVFERGAGETRACGSGACAAAVCARRFYNAGKVIIVEQAGGSVEIRWEGDGKPVFLTGNAVNVFEGETIF